MGSVTEMPKFDIPSHCKAGVVVNEGPDFHVEVQQVPVPEPGKLSIETLRQCLPQGPSIATWNGTLMSM